MSAAVPFVAKTLTEWIGQRALRHGDRVALCFVGDEHTEISWTYRQLWARACHVASRLPDVDQPAPRALMLFPPGLEFMAGFLGCQIAGWIPVPTCLPKPGREMPRLDSAANDCLPSAIIGDRETLKGIDQSKLCDSARDLPLVATDIDDETIDSVDVIDPQSLRIDPESLALLQYTSGSTSDPKGVMVRHRNLIANLEAIRQGFNIDFQDDSVAQTQCGVFWLPFFHDMGLIGGILEPLYIGGRTVLMSPQAFLRRPIQWLRCISEYQAVISGAPNFAYQLCIDRIAAGHTDDLDLSSWAIAFCGAEPIFPRTLSDFSNRFAACGFSASSFYPCYGLAEATLLAAGGDGPAATKVISLSRDSLGSGHPRVTGETDRHKVRQLVSCGEPVQDTELLIVNPKTRAVVDEDTVGEIWLRGKNIAAGYWNRDAENEGRFGASLSSGDGGFCRTGDLGFLHDGQLYVTGRIKDVIIIRGRNISPQDVEATVRQTVGSAGGQAAALSIDGPRGEALAIVAELPRRISQEDLPRLIRDMRRAVIETHDVDPRYVLLVRQATIPLTSSGKVRRNRCRELFNAKTIKCMHRYDRASLAEQTPVPMPSLPKKPSEEDRQSVQQTIETWITQWLIARSGIEPSEIQVDKPFTDFGLDSLSAVELSGEIEDWSGVELTPMIAAEHPDIAQMSGYVCGQLIGDRLIVDDHVDDPPRNDLNVAGSEAAAAD